MQRTEPCGSPEALSSVLEQIEPDIRAITVRFRIPVAEAEDLLQDTALAFLSCREPIHSPRAWFLSVYRNRCLLFWRSRRRRFIEAVDTALLVEVAGGAEVQSRRDLKSDLNGALNGLPQRCRTILGMRYGLDCSSPQIAESLDTKVATVRQATLRCLSALSRCLVAVGFIEETTT